MHAKCYKSLSPLTHDDQEDGQYDDTQAMKSFLAMPGRGLQLAGLGARIKSMGTAKNLSARQKQILRECASQMERMASTAKGMGRREADPELQKQIDELKANNDRMLAALDRVRPHRVVG